MRWKGAVGLGLEGWCGLEAGKQQAMPSLEGEKTEGWLLMTRARSIQQGAGQRMRPAFCTGKMYPTTLTRDDVAVLQHCTFC